MSVKKAITWGLIFAFIAGSVAVGGPFNLIDIILVRPIVNIQLGSRLWSCDYYLYSARKALHVATYKEPAKPDEAYAQDSARAYPNS